RGSSPLSSTRSMSAGARNPGPPALICFHHATGVLIEAPHPPAFPPSSLRQYVGSTFVPAGIGRRFQQGRLNRQRREAEMRGGVSDDGGRSDRVGIVTVTNGAESVDLAYQFVALNKFVDTGATSDDALQRLAELAVDAVPGCTSAAITVWPADRR